MPWIYWDFASIIASYILLISTLRCAIPLDAQSHNVEYPPKVSHLKKSGNWQHPDLDAYVFPHYGNMSEDMNISSFQDFMTTVLCFKTTLISRFLKPGENCEKWHFIFHFDESFHWEFLLKTKHLNRSQNAESRWKKPFRRYGVRRTDSVRDLLYRLGGLKMMTFINVQ